MTPDQVGSRRKSWAVTSRAIDLSSKVCSGSSTVNPAECSRKKDRKPDSFSSRLRRMVVGQHHHVSPQYLHQYANQAAWLEDNRRTSNGGLAHGLVANAMGCPVNRAWKGYWQRAV